MVDGEKQARLRGRMSENSDQRAVVTRRRIVSAYRDLVDSGAGVDVPVTRVVRSAGVTRSSFYAHFANTSELAVEALAEVFDVVASVDSAERSDSAVSWSAASEHSLFEVIRFIDERRDVYRDLLYRPEGFFGAVESAFMERSLVTLLAGPRTEADPEITARFIAAGVMGVVSWWLRSDSALSSADIAHALAAIIPADFTRP